MAVRIAPHHFNNNTRRPQLDKLSCKATPREWCNSITASSAIKLFNNSDTNIAESLRDKVYINGRAPGCGKFIDNSRLKIGSQNLPHRLGPIFATISFQWIGDYKTTTLGLILREHFLSITNDKKTIFTFYYNLR